MKQNKKKPIKWTAFSNSVFELKASSFANECWFWTEANNWNGSVLHAPHNITISHSNMALSRQYGQPKSVRFLNCDAPTTTTTTNRSCCRCFVGMKKTHIWSLFIRCIFKIFNGQHAEHRIDAKNILDLFDKIKCFHFSFFQGVKMFYLSIVKMAFIVLLASRQTSQVQISTLVYGLWVRSLFCKSTRDVTRRKLLMVDGNCFRLVFWTISPSIMYHTLDHSRQVMILQVFFCSSFFSYSSSIIFAAEKVTWFHISIIKNWIWCWIHIYAITEVLIIHLDRVNCNNQFSRSLLLWPDLKRCEMICVDSFRCAYIFGIIIIFGQNWKQENGRRWLNSDHWLKSVIIANFFSFRLVTIDVNQPKIWIASLLCEPS